MTTVRRSLFAWGIACLLGILAAAGYRPAAAAPVHPSISGTVVTFETGTQILTVNTRLGVKTFQLTTNTIILLNNHNAAATDILAGDQVTVTYLYPSFEALIVHLFRESTREGKITSATGTSVVLRLNSNTSLNLTTNGNSVLELAGIPITNTSVLVGRHATVVFETNTFAIISLSASAPTLNGAITAIDTASRTISVQTASRTVNLTVDTAATVRRDGATSTFANLQVGDKVRVAYVQNRGAFRALAIDARSVPPPVTAPTGLTLTSLSQNQIQLSWIDNSADETGFRIERRSSTERTFREIATAPSAAGTGTTVTFTDSNVTPALSYEYRVRAYRTIGSTIVFSLYSNVAGPIVPVNPPPTTTARKKR